MAEDISRPAHIAIIPDGNRRWGKEHGISEAESYSKGIAHIEEVLNWCKESEIRILSMWGFSTENFERDKSQVSALFELFKINLRRVIETDEKNVRIRFLGRTHLFPKELRFMMNEAEKRSPKNAKYQLNLLLAYGGRQEIVDAVNEIIKKGEKKVDEETLSRHLYSRGIPDPDLIIRTSGEQRLSGLMPWQSCYSELYFSKKLWPDFGRGDFDDALLEYAKRKRRYGK